MEANLVLSETLGKSARLSSLDSVANIYQDSHFYVFLKGGGGGVKGTPGPSLASFLYSSLCLSFAFEGNYSQILLIDNSFHSVMRSNAF